MAGFVISGRDRDGDEITVERRALHPPYVESYNVRTGFVEQFPIENPGYEYYVNGECVSQQEAEAALMRILEASSD